MKSLIYKNYTIPIYINQEKSLLIAQKELAKIYAMSEASLEQLFMKNSYRFKMKEDYYIHNDTFLWSVKGIYKLTILIWSPLAIDFSIFLENSSNTSISEKKL